MTKVSAKPVIADSYKACDRRAVYAAAIIYTIILKELFLDDLNTTCQYFTMCSAS